MKKILQSMLGLLMMLGLAMAVIWLVRNAPNPSQKSLAQATVTPNQQPSVAVTSIPKATPHDKVTLTATIEPTTKPNTSINPQHHPEPTVTATFELNFDTASIMSIEEITTPVGLVSPDKQKMLVPKEASYQHVLSGNKEEAFYPIIPVNLWVRHHQTGQEIKISDRAIAWDWSPDSQKVVYIVPVGNEGLNGELHIFNLDTLTDQKILDTDIVQSYPGPFWLSNNEVVYMDKAKFWIMQPNGNNRRLLNNLEVYREEASNIGREEYNYSPEKLAGRLYISPDETRMAYITASAIEPDLIYQVRLADLTGNNQVEIAKEAAFRKWSTNGDYFLYQTSLPNNPIFADLWMADKDGSNPRRLLDVTEWGKNIDYKNSDIVQRPGMIGHVAPSPTGKQVAFSEFTEKGLWLLDINSMEYKFLPHSDELGPILSLFWLTGNKLIISTKSGTLGMERTYLRLTLDN